MEGVTLQLRPGGGPVTWENQCLRLFRSSVEIPHQRCFLNFRNCPMGSVKKRIPYGTNKSVLLCRNIPQCPLVEILQFEGVVTLTQLCARHWPKLSPENITHP